MSWQKVCFKRVCELSNGSFHAISCDDSKGPLINKAVPRACASLVPPLRSISEAAA